MTMTGNHPKMLDAEGRKAAPIHPTKQLAMRCRSRLVQKTNEEHLFKYA